MQKLGILLLLSGGIDIIAVDLRKQGDDMSLNENGLPKDRNYLECGLPDFLQDSIRAMKDAWGRLDRGIEYLRWDCDYCNLQSDINSAEVNQLISEEQAWFLREKYLRQERV